MCSVLTKTSLENLSKFKIHTVIDVLQEDPKKLASFSKLNFRDIISLRQTLITNYSPFPRQGLNAYNELLSNCSYISTGIPQLDNLLDGGFLTGNVYEICGLSGSGKTQLCLTFVSHVALTVNKFIHFIDTKLDFSGERVHSILEAKEKSEEKIGRAMEKICVTRVHNFSDLYSCLYHIKNQLVAEPASIRVIVIESLPAVFLHFMGAHKMDGLGMLNCFASLVKYLAQEHHVCIIVVNLASMWVEEESTPLLTMDSESASATPQVEVKPVLGKYWNHVPNTRLYIQQCEPPNLRKISVLKSSHLPPGNCTVSLSIHGVT